MKVSDLISGKKPVRRGSLYVPSVSTTVSIPVSPAVDLSKAALIYNGTYFSGSYSVQPILSLQSNQIVFFPDVYNGTLYINWQIDEDY